jgi:glycosyltransferase involved in cell wall biosynthesis
LKGFIEVIQGAGQVHLVGPQPDATRLLSEADIVWTPSWSEGGANVVLEAMAAGRPVVASSCGSLPEIIVDGTTGFLIPTEDKAALARQTRVLLDDPGLGNRMGEAGRQRTLKNYRVVDLAGRFGEIYKAVTSSSHRESVAR